MFHLSSCRLRLYGISCHGFPPMWSVPNVTIILFLKWHLHIQHMPSYLSAVLCHLGHITCPLLTPDVPYSWCSSIPDVPWFLRMMVWYGLWFMDVGACLCFLCVFLSSDAMLCMCVLCFYYLGPCSVWTYQHYVLPWHLGSVYLYELSWFWMSSDCSTCSYCICKQHHIPFYVYVGPRLI